MFNETHIQKIKNGKVVKFCESMTMSSVALFNAFVHTDLKMNKKIAIVTYEGLTNFKFKNMYDCVWNGIEGVDYFLFIDSNLALDKMNEIVKKYK